MGTCELKKFLVRTADGKTITIEAQNAHDAVTKARNLVGQLPNEINTKIIKKLLVDLQSTISFLSETSDNIRANGRELDWEKIYLAVKDISVNLKTKAETYTQMAGSMVKINKEK